MKVYRHSSISELIQFYNGHLIDFGSYASISDHLSVLANRMYEGVLQKESVIFKEINNYHSDYLGVPIPDLMSIKWSLADCQKAIANEYGFENWQTVNMACEQPYQVHFEQAVNNLLAGGFDQLKEQLKANPELIQTTSQYGHQATLLHYTASNGVEMWRQQVPENLPAITQLLLDNGADTSAKMNVYGGEFDTLTLLTSSAHPIAAGVLKAMRVLF